MENTEASPTIKAVKALPIVDDYPAERIAEFFPGTKKNNWHKSESGYWFHSTCGLGYNVKAGKGTLIGPHVHFGTSGPIAIGKDCVIGSHCSVYGSVTIGDNTVLGVSCCLETGVTVGSDVTIGDSAYIYPNIAIPNEASVPDGAQVTQFVGGTTTYKPRTQKARGIKALKNKGFATPDYTLTPVEDVTGDKIKSLVGRFVRPCPVTPRHGFVDSRPVNTTDDAIALLAETKEADPKAEILTMPFIKAAYSGIWTTGSLTIGPGNDGATSGHGSVRIPVQGHPQSRRWTQTLKDAGITEQPYLEILWEGNSKMGKDRYGRAEKQPFKTIYVQLRNGPSLPASEDFIPSAVKIKRIIVASGDLLAWESKIKDVTPGTVVYHPGGSLASHYAVHAVLNKVPVLVTRKPKVGETLEPCSEVLEPNLDKIRAGFVLGCRADLSYSAACRVMLAGCHSTSLWLGKFDILLGLAMGCAYRLIIAAGLGEGRHTSDGYGHNQKTREQIYEICWNRVLHQTYRKKYFRVLYLFKNRSWRGGFGGKNWFELCQWAGKMYNSLLDGNVKQALENLNGAVHAVHNGGWAFNKFIGEEELNQAAVNPVVPLLDVIPSLYQYLADENSYKSAPKWWKNRTKISVDGESEAEQEEPQLDLHNGTEDCGCSKMECKNCFPDGHGCDCSAHSCKMCFPEGCQCKDKKCHDCGQCDTCVRIKIQTALDAFEKKCKQMGAKPKIGKTNHSTHLKGKRCFSCGKAATVKFKYSGYIIPSCSVHALNYTMCDMVLESEDPDTDYETAPPVKLAHTAPSTPSAILNNQSYYQVVLGSTAAPVQAKLKTKTTAVDEVQAKMLNATQLHIQFKKTGQHHESYNIDVPSGQLSAIKKVFADASEYGQLCKSWTSDLVSYLPLTKTDSGWWRLGNIDINVPKEEIKTVSEEK